MLIDIRPDEFEKMARAGFFENVHLRAQDIETARARASRWVCKQPLRRSIVQAQRRKARLIPITI